MSLGKAFRYNLRHVRQRLAGIHVDKTIDRIVMGDRYEAWAVSPDGLGPDAVVYSVGIGDDVAWDLEMIGRFGVEIHGFDPTPRCLEWIGGQELPARFRFHDYGVGAADGTLRFHRPPKNDCVNYSTVKSAGGGDEEMIELPVRALSSIMKDLGHEAIDVLKIDIEGGEYDVLESMLASGICPGQLLVEYHHLYDEVPFARTAASIRALKRLGYRLFYVSERSYNFCFLRRCDSIGS